MSARLGVILAVALFHAFTADGWGAEKIRVVTTTSDLRSLVETVGAERVAVMNLAIPSQNAEAYEPRPQDLQKLRGAQMVVKIGLDYDLWIERMLATVGDPSLQRGGKGYLDASAGIALLEVRPTTFTPPTGHNHGAGNPHYWLDPANGEIISGGIMETLSRLDPANASRYRANRAAFLTQLHAKIEVWKSTLARFNGQPVIAYHNSWPYFARRFRLRIIDYIEPNPGVPAAPKHLAGLVKTIKTAGIRVIIKQPFEPEQAPKMLASHTGARVAVLASSIGGVPQAHDYLSMFDYNVAALAAALPESH